MLFDQNIYSILSIWFYLNFWSFNLLTGEHLSLYKSKILAKHLLYQPTLTQKQTWPLIHSKRMNSLIRLTYARHTICVTFTGTMLRSVNWLICLMKWLKIMPKVMMLTTKTVHFQLNSVWLLTCCQLWIKMKLNRCTKQSVKSHLIISKNCKTK